MAQPIACDTHQGEPVLADVLVTVLESGDAKGMCWGCLIGMAAAVAAQLGMGDDDPEPPEQEPASNEPPEQGTEPPAEATGEAASGQPSGTEASELQELAS